MKTQLGLRCKAIVCRDRAEQAREDLVKVVQTRGPSLLAPAMVRSYEAHRALCAAEKALR